MAKVFYIRFGNDEEFIVKLKYPQHTLALMPFEFADKVIDMSNMVVIKNKQSFSYTTTPDEIHSLIERLGFTKFDEMLFAIKTTEETYV